jgi:hypothetical protein
MAVTFSLTVASAPGELSSSHWEIDVISPSMEMIELLELWWLLGGLPDGAVAGSVARAVSSPGNSRAGVGNFL